MSKKRITTNTITNPLLIDLAAAHAQAKEQIDAVPDSALVRMVFDIPYATTIAMGAADRIDQILPDLAELPRYDMTPVRSLRTYAGAALHAHLLAREPTPRPASMPALLKEAGRLRGDLSVLAEALARLGLFSAEHVAAIRGGRSHAEMANALCGLATLYDQKWAEIGTQVPISRDTIALAAKVGTQLQVALGKRRLPSEPRELRDERRRVEARAFALFFHAYDHCRRGVTFVRWRHGDVDRFVPSLYGKRKRKPSAPLLPDLKLESGHESGALESLAAE
jgi:hypothetical protein